MLILNKQSQEELWRRHALSDPLVSDYVRRHNGPVVSLPICPKCERAGLRSSGWAEHHIMTCPHCGYNGPTDTQFSMYSKKKKFL